MSHTLAIRLRHRDADKYMALAIDVRKQVEVALLDQIAIVVSTAVQDRWLVGANLPIQTTTVNGVTSYTLTSIDALFQWAIDSQFPAGFSLASGLETACTHCDPLHCDRAFRPINCNGSLWSVEVLANPSDSNSLIKAFLGLEFRYPSPS